MAGSDASEGQALWQPGRAEEDSRLREDSRHLHLAYDEEETAASMELEHIILACTFGRPEQRSRLH